MLKICQICGNPFSPNSNSQIYCANCIPRNPGDPAQDPVITAIIYLWDCGLSIHSISQKLHISDQKTRRIMIEFGLYSTPQIQMAQQLHAAGKSVDEIAAALGCKRKNVIAMLPYDKGSYNLKTPTANAARLRQWRKQKEDKK